MIKLYRNVITIIIIFLNILLLLTIYCNFYDEIVIEYNISNIFNFFVFIFIYIHMLIILNTIKSITNWKLLNIWLYLIHLIVIFVLLYTFAFNIKSLTTMIEVIQLKEDEIYKGSFCKVYYIYSKEQCLNMVRVYYAQYSTIKSPLSDELVEKILNNATKMKDVKENVIQYCKNEPTEIIDTFQSLKNYYYNNKTWIFLLAGITSVNIIFVLFSIYHQRTILIVDAPSLDHLRTIISVVYHLITQPPTEENLRNLQETLVRIDNLILEILRRIS